MLKGSIVPLSPFAIVTVQKSYPATTKLRDN